MLLSEAEQKGLTGYEPSQQYLFAFSKYDVTAVYFDDSPAFSAAVLDDPTLGSKIPVLRWALAAETGIEKVMVREMILCGKQAQSKWPSVWPSWFKHKIEVLREHPETAGIANKLESTLIGEGLYNPSWTGRGKAP